MDEARSKSDYFMLLVRDPGILEARTLADKDIFYNPDGGLPRAEREIAALIVSRFNGGIFCASVHARFAAIYSKRRDDIQRFLDNGVGADVRERWNAIAAASVGRKRLRHPSARAAARSKRNCIYAHGEILLQCDSADLAQAERAFLAAIRVAKQRGACSFELRAALSHAKFYHQSTGHPAGTHAVLAPALEEFSPASEMPEIRGAQALMEHLVYGRFGGTYRPPDQGGGPGDAL